MTDPKATLVIVGTGSANARFLGAQGMAPIKDSMPEPVIQGRHHGRAWRTDLVEQRRRAAIDPRDDATLVHWIIEAPWAHPLWHSYSLVMVHLRPLRDGRKTLFYLDGATHEFWLYAINAEADRSRMLVDTKAVGKNWLSPCNFGAQIIAKDDDAALDRIEGTVKAICDGQLSPDTDFTSSWVALFGDNMMKHRADPRPPDIREDRQH